VRYAFLANWAQLHKQCSDSGGTWPLPESQAKAASDWLTVATGTAGAPVGWTPMTHVNEGGLTPQEFADRFIAFLVDAHPLPADIPQADPRTAVRVQEVTATLANRGTWADVRPDPAASNGQAVWMPETHHEWAFQMYFRDLPEKVQQGQWKVYAVVRLEKGNVAREEMPAWTMGVYDEARKVTVAQAGVRVRDASAEYRSYLVGTVQGNPNLYAWLAPSPESAAKSVWVDCLIFVPATPGGQ